MRRRDLLKSSVLAGGAATFWRIGLPWENLARAADVSPLTPDEVVPSARQLAWHELEFYGFLHFTMNTFTDREWGYGDEDPQRFNPTEFDADQIVGSLKDAGMKGVILTAKHHDGFCLWPTATTEHSVKNSPFRDGHGDVVREISEAARKHGLLFGVYLSPWDRNHAMYGKPGYVDVYREQLRELLTQYGPIFEVWHDGANGGDGYYGGAKETRTIDKKTYYGWPETWAMVRELQPNAVIFTDVGPDVRWVGNEGGWAGDPCWCRYSPTAPDGSEAGPGLIDSNRSPYGDRFGKAWLPAEVDVSIRPGWFWHESQNTQVRSPENLVKIYYESIGRGASFLLNVPPDRRGLVHENDVQSMKEFRRIMDATFAKNLADDAKVTASNERGDDYRAANLLDDDRQKVWAAMDGVTTAEIVFDLPQSTTFDVVAFEEQIAHGQRIGGWAVDYFRAGEWNELAKGESVGHRRLWRGEAVTTDRVRLRITEASAASVLRVFGLYKQP
ncbi:MAG: alpha-L-fucosidase [Thermoguttaceae bacterium]|nr:alpha-L-fucosidase [Thermoguttaceae bacterium]